MENNQDQWSRLLDRAEAQQGKKEVEESPPVEAYADDPEARSLQAASGGGEGNCEPPDIPGFPVIDKAAYYGITREVADLATENSEADPVAVLGSFLAAAPAMLGAKKTLWIGDTRHYPRLFVTLAGMSSKARKGTSLQPVTRIINKVHETAVRTAEHDFGIELLKIESGAYQAPRG